MSQATRTVFDTFEDYRIKSDVSSHSIIFHVHRTTHWDPEGTPVPPLFMWAYLKWDGCFEFRLEDGQVHFCGEREAIGLGRLIAQLYVIAKNELETYRSFD